MKSKVDKLDVGKLLPAPVDLSKLSDVVKNNAFNDEALEMMLRWTLLKIKYLTLLT